MVLRHGAGNIKWSVIAAQLPGRIGKQCRERWFNHLDPDIKKGDWTPDEDAVLFETQRVRGRAAESKTSRCRRTAFWPRRRASRRILDSLVHSAGPRQPLERDRQAPARPDRKRRQEPLELVRAEAMAPRPRPPGRRAAPGVGGARGGGRRGARARFLDARRRGASPARARAGVRRRRRGRRVVADELASR